MKDHRESDRTSIFRFKQFEVDQTSCAMKINTDGVLLAALARLPEQEGRRIGSEIDRDLVSVLDIGTGTGVVALMLAQRFPWAEVDAIEIDPAAAERAHQNFSKSPFTDRLEAKNISLKDYAPAPSTAKYDLIVSNPPFFVDALRNPDQRKQLARHTDFEFFHTLLERSQRWLLPGGHLQLILPPDLAKSVEATAVNAYGFSQAGQIAIYSFAENKKPVRILLDLQNIAERTKRDDRDERLVIYQDRGVYSEAYQSLLKDLFLAF